MYKKILVPLDGSPIAECVLSHLEKLISGTETEVELITVVEKLGIPTRGGIAVSEDELKKIDLDIEQEAYNYLYQTADRLGKLGIKAHPTVLTGKIIETLLQYIESNDIELVIVASHGRSGISRWFWGSVTEKLMRATNVPILLVKASSCEDSSDGGKS